jgi:NDP-sugar pyrophosphorylase family protein
MINIVIPMAGLGTRFQKIGIDKPKPLIVVNGKTLIEHSIDSFNVKGKFIFITRDFDNPEHNKELTDIFEYKNIDYTEIRISNTTDGAADTVLFAKDLIDNDNPLVVYNCDQIIKWDSMGFLEWIKDKDPDAALVLYKSKDPKNSFAEIKLNRIVKVVEKDPISDNALIGFHYWKSGKDFVTSAKKLLDNFRISGRPECYISETFNYLRDAKILPFHIINNAYIPLGTPEDIAKYLGKVGEFDTNKPKTLFIDIDGTVLKHEHTISGVYKNTPTILPGVVDKINEWDSKGHKIIFVTARKESTRKITEEQLSSFGLAWDQLVMGVSSGSRYIINDKMAMDDMDRAIGISAITNSGFNTINWTDYGL